MALDHEGPYLRIERIEPDADWPAGCRTRLVAYNADGTPDPEGQAVIDTTSQMFLQGVMAEVAEALNAHFNFKNQSKETDHE